MSLVIIVGRMLAGRARAREEDGLDGFSSQPEPQTEEQRARDRQTAMIWTIGAVLVPCLLVLAYLVTR